MCIFQPDVFPRLAAVNRLEDSGAVGGITANRRFSRACVNYIVIGWRNRDRANRRNRLFIEKWNPVRAAIDCFPYAACNRAEIIRVRLADDAFDG